MPLIVQILVLMNFVPFRRNVKNAILIITIGALIIIFSGNIVTPDQAAYNDVYNGLITGAYFEGGYQLLCTFFYSINVDYQTFKLVIFILSLVLIKKTFQVSNLIWCIVVPLWALTSFWHDAEQSRFTMAYIIVLFSFRYLDNSNKSNKWKYCACILLAGQFHTAAYIYFVLLILFAKNKHQIIIIIDYLAISFSLLVAINGNDLSFIGSILYKLTKYERIRMWFEFHTNFGYLGILAIQLILHSLLYYSKSILYDNRSTAKLSEKKIVDLAYNVNAILFIAFPLYIASTDFIRIIRGMFILDYIALAIAYFNIPIIRKRIYFSIGIAFLGFVYNIYIFGSPFGAFSSDYFMQMIIKNSWL